MLTKKVIFPGTFDPLTNGHLDLLIRSSKIFNLVILGVANNKNKKPLFSLKERINLAIQVTSHLKNVKVIGFNNSIINFANEQKINLLIRGIRTISNIEYELQLAKINKYLMPEIETIFMMASENCSCISSTLIKEIALSGGKINKFLPRVIIQALRLKLNI